MADIGVDIRPDTVPDVRRVDAHALRDLVQRLGLGADVVLRRVPGLPDARDGQTQHDRVDHADHHRHVLDDVRRLAGVVVVPDAPVAQGGHQHHDSADGRHRESENKPFRHGFLRRSARPQRGDREDRGCRDEQGERDERGAVPGLRAPGRRAVGRVDHRLHRGAGCRRRGRGRLRGGRGPRFRRGCGGRGRRGSRRRRARRGLDRLRGLGPGRRGGRWWRRRGLGRRRLRRRGGGGRGRERPGRAVAVGGDRDVALPVVADRGVAAVGGVGGGGAVSSQARQATATRQNGRSSGRSPGGRKGAAGPRADAYTPRIMGRPHPPHASAGSDWSDRVVPERKRLPGGGGGPVTLGTRVPHRSRPGVLDHVPLVPEFPLPVFRRWAGRGPAGRFPSKESPDFCGTWSRFSSFRPPVPRVPHPPRT